MSRYSPLGVVFGLVVSAIVLAPIIFILAVAASYLYFCMKDYPIVGVILAPVAGAGSIICIVGWLNRHESKSRYGSREK